MSFDDIFDLTAGVYFYFFKCIPGIILGSPLRDGVDLISRGASQVVLTLTRITKSLVTRRKYNMVNPGVPIIYLYKGSAWVPACSG